MVGWLFTRLHEPTHQAVERSALGVTVDGTTLTKVKACPQAKYTLRTLAGDNTAEKRGWCWRWGRDSLSPAAHCDYDVESNEALERCAS